MTPAPTMRSSETPEQILDRLDFTVLRRLDGRLQGDYRSLFRGGGIDFTDLRDYEPQDDTRHIDWNVTARMNSPFVRQYVEDRELTAWFLLDRSASMTFGGETTKAAMVVDMVAALARVLTRGGNRVGALLWDNRVQQLVEPRSGRSQVLRITKVLQGAAEPAAGATNLASLGEIALASIRRRALVFVVSDFVSEPGWERPFATLARRHEVVGIRIVDPAELELPNAGVIVMQDSETGEQLHVDTSNPELRRRFAEAAVRRDERILAATRRIGLDLHNISTDSDLLRAIVSMAEQRKRRLR